ncbi:hypothetical protein NLG97_g6789 [Lecanicillium saksenae]|uniref:Uncharacterized protein n=1 Tax=Lecanicillium saksenae TaxID=468837 RepID=A0ACC1QNN5_9HYPO|nr:hypothetical protein NLG97_g6789 [Lecanicillium saksenae]
MTSLEIVMMKTSLLLLPLAVSAWELGDSFDNVPTPVGTPGPAPEYAKNNINNREGVAPDKGVLDGPVLAPLNETLLAMIHNNAATESMSGNISSAIHSTVDARDGTDYWLPGVAGKGVMPLAPAGYQFYRNVKDFGAVGDGQTDDTAAINRAVAAFSKDNTEKTRCGKECGSSTTLQALVYFPPGKYLVSTPIIQYYHTQFVGNPNNKPTLKGAANFSGIAIVDNDVYIPGGNGAEWYINQSNFLRQIRNIDFDLLDMSNGNNQGDQSYTPTGIHWQVGQATSIENCNFRMPVSTGSGSTTAVGIFMENGSGGTMSDLNFFGGNIGIIAGSQQFTATNLHFLSCLTGVKQLWNWGFVYKNILMINVKVGFDLTAYSDASKQGVGSISLIDSTFANVPQPITVGPDANHRPSLVLDKISASNSGPVVSVPGGETILGPGAVEQWISGYQVLPGEMQGQKRSGVPNPVLERPYKLVSGSDGRYFYQVKPHYGSSSNVFVVTDMGVKNDGTGDQTDAINKILSERMPGEITYFPAGIYQVQGTVHVPVGAIIVGSSWSQIQASGHYFADDDNPRVMVQLQAAS